MVPVIWLVVTRVDISVMVVMSGIGVNVGYDKKRPGLSIGNMIAMA